MATMSANDSIAAPRPRVLMVSYGCDPYTSMETRLGWFRALTATRRCDVDMVCHGQNRSQYERRLREAGPTAGLTMHFLESTPWERRLCATPGLFYHGYRRWHERAYRLAQELHAERPFDLAHQVGYCGFREPGFIWKLGVPFIWGPVGGTQNFPWRFLGLLDWRGALYELGRNVANSCQLRYRTRVSQAARAATRVFAANSTAQRDLERFVHVTAELQLETGLAELPPLELRRRSPDEPLRILWSGRFQPWKALPLLLRALARLDKEIHFEVRIVGFEKRETLYRNLARRLGVESRIEWIGWPSYADSFAHYRWADVFVFTSLRDTSGTGLLEALAHGRPIIGLNHQGARDIMTPQCALPIAVESPPQAIGAIRSALIDLARNPDKLLALSRGARARAEAFLWSDLGQRMTNAYFAALSLSSPAEALSSSAAPPLRDAQVSPGRIKRLEVHAAAPPSAGERAGVG